ncbi:MAG: sulfur oxidation c-type cytochrome SoxA [Betaproteobacteria bacterium]|nr:sulfur oxidation c-type cytochrome SoxA [Betaproteobacteria bacterium]
MLFAAALPLMVLAQPVMPPEQERAHLQQTLQKKLPGTGLAQWVLGYEGVSSVATEKVTAIPFNDDNATNSADILAIGKKFWDRKFANGKSFAHCFPNAGKRVAVNYPQVDAKSKQVVTLEAAINRCLVLHDEKPLDPGDRATLGPLSAYLKSLSDGQRLAVRVAGQIARDKFESGRLSFTRRMGPMDAACATCHVHHAGKLYGDKGLSPAIGLTANWPRLEPGGAVLTLHNQFQRCMSRVGAEPFAAGGDEFNNLEYYLSYLSNGAPLRTLATQR